MKTVIICLLLTLVLSQTTLVLSSPSTVNLVAPSGFFVVAEAYHSAVNPNYLGNGAQWIWLNGSSSWADGFSATFQSSFYADCPQVEAYLRITADNEFKVTLNSVLVGTGGNWFQVFVFPVKLRCGKNDLVIQVINRDEQSPAALVFTVVQDQSKCPDCLLNPSAFYNRQRCQCQCSTRCPCRGKLHQWYDYPICGCKCKKDLLVRCQPGFYFQERLCRCICKRVWCIANLVQDPYTCKCVCKPQECPDGSYWDKFNCKCVKLECAKTKCEDGKFWHKETCSCDCPILFVPCEYGQDQKTCQCNPAPEA